MTTASGVTVLLVSTYELGRQPFGLASPAAWLRASGADVIAVDASRDRLEAAQVEAADLVAFHLPMHTATRTAVPLLERVRRLNPRARLCCYGLYAPLNADWLRGLGVDVILGGEFEQGLVAAAIAIGQGNSPIRTPSTPSLPRLAFIPPDRSGLPALDRYAALRMPDGEHRTVGYTEASRGCKHRCRHCPVVPVYDGQFRIVPVDVVLADIRGQVSRGARHITFGDPDFFNGVGHAAAVVQRLARECPGLTYDVTIKVEHLLRHEDRLAMLRDTGCLFVTTAAESVDDRILALLDKGHTRADFIRVVDRCGALGLVLSPTFVAFTPWTTLEGYCDLLDDIAALALVEHVAPIQLTIRLLLPQGSRLLDLPDVHALVGAFEPATLVYPWAHPDPRVDELQRELVRIVGARVGAGRSAVFGQVRAAARLRAGRTPAGPLPRVDLPDRATVPYLTEPWYC